MNWGHKITLVILAFITAMLSMVYVAMRQTNEMMDKNYYEQELKYQALIDAAQNLNAISHEPVVQQNAEGLVLQIPEVLLSGFKDGKVELLKSDDQAKDISLNFSPDSNGLFLIKKSELHTGSYRARIRWSSQGKAYYREQELNVEG